MTEQPVETEQQFLGNVTREQIAEAARFGVPLPAAPLQHYAPNAHRIPRDLTREQAILDELAAGTLPAADLAHERKEPDLWLDAEGQTHRALVEIQDGNINAGIAYLQAALAFAQNHRHSLTEVTAR